MPPNWIGAAESPPANGNHLSAARVQNAHSAHQRHSAPGRARIKAVTIALALAMYGTGAAAELSPSAVWHDLRDIGALNGVTISGDVEDAGDRLIVRDVSMLLWSAEDLLPGAANSEADLDSDPQSSVRVDMDRMNFVSDGPERVRIEYSDAFSILAFDAAIDPMRAARSDASTLIDFAIEETGASFVANSVHGDSRSVAFEFQSLETAFRLVELVTDDPEFEEVASNLDLKLVYSNAKSRDVYSKTATFQSIDSEFGADRIGLEISEIPAGESGSADSARDPSISVAVDGFESSSVVAQPSDADPQDLQASVEAGLEFDYAASTESISMKAFGRDGSGFGLEAGPFAFIAKLSDSVLSMEALQESIGILVHGESILDAISKPLAMRLESAGLGFEIPMLESREPQEFGLSFHLAKLSLEEAIWDRLDPDRLIPREVIDLALDVGGTGGLVAEAETEGFSKGGDVGDGYMLPLTIALNELALGFGEASIEGKGEAAFDWDATAADPGHPDFPDGALKQLPVGWVEFDIVGVNALLDKLVESGALAEGDVLGARMSLLLFSESVGDDHLRSRIETNAEGHLLVNGQRIQ